MTAPQLQGSVYIRYHGIGELNVVITTDTLELVDQFLSVIEKTMKCIQLESEMKLREWIISELPGGHP